MIPECRWKVLPAASQRQVPQRKNDQPSWLDRRTRGGRMFTQYRRFHFMPLAAAAALVPALLGPVAAQGYGYGSPPTNTPPTNTPPPTSTPATVQSYKQVNLISDQPGVALKT